MADTLERPMWAIWDDEAQRADLRTAQVYMAYLTGKPGSVYGDYELTTWTGGKLATVTYAQQGRHNIGGKLYRFRAIDVHGQHWHGTSPGPGMYARMRRSKGKR